MSTVEQGRNREAVSEMVDKERGVLSQWLTSRRKEITALVGGMMLMSGGVAMAAEKNPDGGVKEKPAATASEKKEKSKDADRDVLEERTVHSSDVKKQSESFEMVVDEKVKDALKEQGVILDIGVLVLKSGRKIHLNGEVGGVKTLRVESRVLPGGAVEFTSFNSDTSQDVLTVDQGVMKSLRNRPAKK